MLDTAIAYENHHTAVRAYVRRCVCPEDVDDVCGDIWLRVVRAAAWYRDNQRLGPWLYTIAHSAIVDMYRKRGRQRECPLTTQTLWNTDVESAVCDRLWLNEAWQTLTDDQRSILIVTLAGYDLQAMAQRFGLKLNTLKSRQRRARLHLQHILDSV